jgi:hypothetical protein
MKKIFPKALFIITLLIMLRALLLGGYPDFNMYYDAALEKNSIPSYPPFTTVLFLFFPSLPLAIASKMWIVLSVFFLFLSLYLCFKIYNVRFFSSTAMIISSLAFIYFPTRFTLGMGQINILILLLVVLTFYFYIRGKDSYSGICLGFSITLKLFPVLLLFYFLLLNKIKIFLYTILTFIGLIGISYLILKPEVNNFYWQHLSSVLNSMPAGYYNQSLSGLLVRQLDNVFLRDLLRVVISAFFTVVSFWIILKNKKRDFSIKTLKFGLIVTLSVFINGYAWQHHFVWLILPFLITFFYIRYKGLANKYYVFLGICYLLISGNIKNFASFPAIIQSHVFIGAVLLWTMNMYFLLKND